MALVLSLSLDLFLMKGNFIAVKVQCSQRQRVTEQAQGRWREKKTKEKGGQNRGLWLKFSQT